jgi:hypothetical protein
MTLLWRRTAYTFSCDIAYSELSSTRLSVEN